MIDQPDFNVDKIVFQVDTTASNKGLDASPGIYVYQETRNRLVLDRQDGSPFTSVSMFDMTGRLIFSDTPDASSVTVSTLAIPQGAYIIHAVTGTKQNVFKVFIR